MPEAFQEKAADRGRPTDMPDGGGHPLSTGAPNPPSLDRGFGAGSCFSGNAGDDGFRHFLG